MPRIAGSLADQAYDRFREGLRSGAFRPGQRVVEVELADWLGMSRTPVREAIRRLQAEGLIAHRPARGLCVAQYDHAEVDELYGMREALEATAARLAARHAGRPDIMLLQRLVEEEARIPPEAVAEHNRRFHRALHQAAHNRYLLRALAPISDALLLLGPTTLEEPGRAAAAREEHGRIVAAVAARDAAAAEAAARAHIAAAHEARLAMAAAEPA
ncbi:GntR family transcriptional regulator [Belnapia rosea]|uniref:DNA-binding transcriptional regulator, GntR family n=1 Tax=Belnapia rosea TaxID=938405 RepID=A0A1G6MF64_9PROT|nr:GntR family transcriptional regulator [Belnapia rosea]SDB43006.1 DNA-binding transcriptional regulator, GntR family [Belnapia rosea]SDC53884.1 DNA-binding transcriptional regulator, GntR family [Belnapia rosea]